MVAKFVGQVFRFKKVLLFLGLVLLMIYRSPSLLIEPRFYAEEGSIYFSYAYSHSWLSNLFSIHLGYYSLLNNIGTCIATTVTPLKYAPFITTYISFLIQLSPFILIIWGSSYFFDNYIKKTVICLIILFSTTGDIWLNLISCQYHLSLAVFLLLIQDTDSAGVSKKWFNRLFLFMASLTGVLACFLTPAFIWKYWKQKNRENGIYASILLFACLVHVAVFIVFITQGYSGNRFVINSWLSTLRNFYLLNILSPIFGQNLSSKYYKAILLGKDFTFFYTAFTAIIAIYSMHLIWVFWSSLKNITKGMALLSFSQEIDILDVGPRFNDDCVSIQHTWISYRTLNSCKIIRYIPGSLGGAINRKKRKQYQNQYYCMQFLSPALDQILI